MPLHDVGGLDLDPASPPFVAGIVEVLLDPSRDPALYHALSILAQMPRAERNSYLARLNTFHSFDLAELAILLKYENPEWTDREIASRLGVSPSTLSRLDRFQEFKPGRDDFVRRRAPSSKRRANRQGGTWPLDHPGW